MKKKIIIGSAILFVLIVIIIVLLIFTNNKITVVLNGKETEKIEVLSSYNDKSIHVKKGKKILTKNKYKVNIKSNVDTSKIGKYKVKYSIKVNGKKYDLNREVDVVDTTSPEIVLSATEVERDYCTKKDKVPITYTVTDNFDQDINDKVIIEEKDDKLIYKVSDFSGNTTEKEVVINYGEKPSNKFTLNGKSKVRVIVNKEYKEQGASYTDGCGNKIDAKITISGNVDTNVEGTYTLTYKVDGMDSINRTVVVTHYDPKNIYLTFDDGPGAYTRKVLSELDKYGVKSTFFVTNQFPGYQNLIKEEHDKGHKIAVHTYSHKYEEVYTSVDDYINDFNKMNEIINEKTGSYSKLFRFPGGSSNTVSRKYKAGVVTEIANEMTNRGYIYVDWNLSSGDADGKSTSEKIISNVVDRVDSCNYNCVILFHDYKKTTANAIGPILEELTSRGYTFSTLDENSPTVHFKIAN